MNDVAKDKLCAVMDVKCADAFKYVYIFQSYFG